MQPLLAGLDLADTMVTFNAPHSQAAHACFLVADKKAHYIAVFKDNQALLCSHLKHLSWRDVLLDRTRATVHGRAKVRHAKTCTVARGLASLPPPHWRCRSCVGVAPSQLEGARSNGSTPEPY
ncbi:hypothetical protein [Streptomyces mirabilis]|uniref:hypothetical protein n=1 Tax=Streptomyces mirabilis TaxID=68239 RepID=UPI0036943E39